MKYLLLLSTLIASAITAEISPNILFRRQTGSCPSGYKVCGSGCIALANTCCPDGAGGCDPTENCQLGSNGQYGCCPKGETCSGAGGAQTSLNTSPATITTSRRTTAVITTSRALTTSVGGGTGDCELGWKECGTGCIPSAWQCCPDKLGGCDTDVERCWLGDDNSYGCCSNRFTNGCTGAAGSPTTLPSDFTDTVTAPSTTRRSSTTATSTPNPLGSTTTTRVSTSSRTTTSASSTSSAASGGSVSEGPETFVNPFASLMTLLMGVFALAI